MEDISRRTMINRSAAALGIALTGSLNGVLGGTAMAKGDAAGYGPLVSDPNGLLSLPEAFSYTIVAQSGTTTLESGEPTPSDPDGTAAFVRRGGNGSVLVNNHEVSGSEAFPVPHVAGDPDGPDNITVSPYGGVMIAEDGDGAQHLVGSTDGGEVFFFARNEHPDESEFTGPTFSRDRRTLFANIQEPGFVLAIQGPFRKQK